MLSKTEISEGLLSLSPHSTRLTPVQIYLLENVSVFLDSKGIASSMQRSVIFILPGAGPENLHFFV